MIEGVVVRELRKNADERGFLMEVLRSDWPELFSKFGQAYVSLNYPGVIHGWHCHRRQDDVFVCVAGMIKVPLYDGRDGSGTKGEINEFIIGDDRPAAIRIPPGVFHGYKTLGVVPSLLLNFPSELYDANAPDELRVPHDSRDVPYDWALRIS